MLNHCPSCVRCCISAGLYWVPYQNFSYTVKPKVAMSETYEKRWTIIAL